jgi:hypothetical protein
MAVPDLGVDGCQHGGSGSAAGRCGRARCCGRYVPGAGPYRIDVGVPDRGDDGAAGC